MSYYQGIPQDGQSLGNSKPQVRTNFQTIYDKFLINHFAYDAVGAGKHKFVQIPTNPGATLPGNANEGIIYTKTGTNTDIYYSPDAGSKEYQITRTDDSNFATFGVANAGWTFLPGSLILQYGFRNTGSSTGTVTFPRTFPSSAFGVWATPYYGSSTPSGRASIAIKNQPADLTTAQFRWIFLTDSGDYTGFFWWAIGN